MHMGAMHLVSSVTNASDAGGEPLKNSCVLLLRERMENDNNRALAADDTLVPIRGLIGCTSRKHAPVSCSRRYRKIVIFFKGSTTVVYLKNCEYTCLMTESLSDASFLNRKCAISGTWDRAAHASAGV